MTTPMSAWLYSRSAHVRRLVRLRQRWRAVRDCRHDRCYRHGDRPCSAGLAEGCAGVAARGRAHGSAHEIAGRISPSDDGAAARGRLQRDRHHRWRIHTLDRGHRTAGRARLQQFRQSDHVRAARSDSCLRHRAQRGAQRVRAGAPPALVPIMTARARVLDYALLVVGLWLAWVFMFRWAGSEALSPPGATFQRVGEYLTSAQFWPHAAATGIAFAYACVIALVGGLFLGLALGTNRLAGQVGEPILASLYSIPKITLYPVILLVFGLGVSAKVAFGALHGIFPVALFAIGALRNTSPVLIKTARVLRLAPVETARTVLLPAALPEVVTGLRIGFSATLLGTLIGELFASDQGLGFMLIRAMEAHKVLDIIALTLLLFAFAAIANVLLLVVERRVHRR